LVCGDAEVREVDWFDQISVAWLASKLNPEFVGVDIGSLTDNPSAYRGGR